MNHTYLASVGVSHIDSLILVERNCSSLGDHLHLHWRNVLSWSLQHPLISRLSVHWWSHTLISEAFISSQHHSLVLSQDEDLLDSILQLFTWLQEEADLTLHQLLGSQLGFTIGSDGVDNDTVLTIGEGGDVDLTNQRSVFHSINQSEESIYLAQHLLIHIRDECLGPSSSDQILLARLPHLAKLLISE